MVSSRFAATTVVSERLVNNCLSTYLASRVNPRTEQVVVPVPVTIQGVAQQVVLSADLSVISVRATLVPNPTRTVSLLFRIFAAVSLTAWRGSGTIAPSGVPVNVGLRLPLASFDVGAVVQLSVDAPLVSQVVGDQFQLGVDLNLARVTRFAVETIQPAVPGQYGQALNTALADPAVPAALTQALRQLGKSGIMPATNALVPAFYDLTMQRPLSPAQLWFSVRVPATELVVRVGAGRVSAGVNVAPYTAAAAASLSDFLPESEADRRRPADVETVANLQFVEDFLNAEVFTRMRGEFVAAGLRLNRVSSFEFKTIGTKVGFREGIAMTIELTYFTDSFFHFVVAGTTAVDATVTLHAYPSLKYGRLYYELNDIDIDLPPWVTTAMLGVAFIAAPLALTISILMDKLLHDVKADLLNSAAGAAFSNSLALEQAIALPGTAGPKYQLSDVQIGMNTTASFKVLSVSGDFGPSSRDVPRLTCNVEELSTAVPPGWVNYEIHKTGSLPGFVIVSLYIPDGLVHPKDPSVHVRWDVLLNGTLITSAGRDTLLSGAGARELRVIPLLFTNPNKSDQELTIVCRLYRPLGNLSDEYLNQAITIFSDDPRPPELKPYVRWSHWVTHWNGHRFVTRFRRSKIHKIPGKGGCRFSGQFLNPALLAPKKFGSIRHMVDLPFDGPFEAHRDQLCDYCFFGGPDKHGRVTLSVDLTAVGSRHTP